VFIPILPTDDAGACRGRVSDGVSQSLGCSFGGSCGRLGLSLGYKQHGVGVF
jgi:hypothetical protein